MTYETLTSKLVAGQQFTHDELAKCEDAVIQTIKRLREFTNFGLRESKDLVDAIKKPGPITNGFNSTSLSREDIYELFKKFSVQEIPALTKEEFLQVLSDAIDAGDKLYYTDMIDIVVQTCTNIRQNGGLTAIAKKIHKFINDI